MMKKTLLCVLCSLFTWAAYAQYEGVNKGDIIDINGIKALVFSIDEDGHGMAMAVKALRGKKNVWGQNAKILSQIDATNSDGEVNTKAVYDYVDSGVCQLSEFPVFAWCKSMGEGWFLPSRDDLEIFVNYYYGNEQDFDWDSDSDSDVDLESLSTIEINEKLISAGGIPFLGNRYAGAISTFGVVTSTKSLDNKVIVFQFDEKKNTFRFKEITATRLDTFVNCRAFYKF